MESLFSRLYLLIWLDDMLCFAIDADRLVSRLNAVFTICLEKCLKLNSLKCDLAAINVPICRRIIDSNAIKFIPVRRNNGASDYC